RDRFVPVIIVHGVNVGRFLVVLEVISVAAANDTFGSVDLKAPTREIEEMNAVITKFARAPVPEPVPVVVQNVVAIRLFRRRTLPHRIIKPIRNWHDFSMTDGTAMIGIPGSSEEHFSNFTGVKGVNRFNHPGPTAALVSHLDNTVVL